MGREGRDTEWKESWSKDNLKTISAMHNIAGGIMIIGKTDSGNVCGISESEAERLLKAVPDTIRNTLDITVDVYIKEENKKLCLYIEVEKGDRIIDYDGKFYKRSGSTTHLMRREELKAIVMTESGKYWMEHPSEVGCSEDISEEAIEYFVNKGKSARRLPGSLNANDADGILKRFDMLYPDGKISVTGAVMFGKRPSKLLGGAFLKIGEFDNKGELLREDYVEGPLIMLPDAAMKALYEKYTQGRFDYSDVARKIKYR
ncbi:MAG: putative DNA binding domain-containing protein, partial [Methanomassiliicoccaceae archaeon]|nr:putative DNA binding domain-containing protein [Methanomassiliicoccaceae archaeon]